MYSNSHVWNPMIEIRFGQKFFQYWWEKKSWLWRTLKILESCQKISWYRKASWFLVLSISDRKNVCRWSKNLITKFSKLRLEIIIIGRRLVGNFLTNKIDKSAVSRRRWNWYWRNVREVMEKWWKDNKSVFFKVK